MLKRSILIAVLIVICTVAFYPRPASSVAQVKGAISFTPRNSELWLRDRDFEIDGVDAKHFYRDASHEAIDLNVMRSHDDLFQEISTKGTEELVAQMMRGQNGINKMFAVAETELKSNELKTVGGFKVLTLRSRQALPDGPVERIEKYFMIPGQTLHAELRWQLDADAKLRDKAIADFEAAVVRNPESAQ